MSGERAGKPLLRLVVPAELPERSRAADATDAPIAEVRGINLHAAQVIDGRDRRRVERLAKYITRPPIAQDRLERRQDGRLELIFKKGGGTAPARWCSSPTT
ncbi:MAG: transposase [Myxococcales bacterium]|nr:transposase [Myxococcales bacterium]